MEETSYSIGYSMAKWARQLGLNSGSLARLMDGQGTEEDISAMRDLVAKEEGPLVAANMFPCAKCLKGES